VTADGHTAAVFLDNQSAENNLKAHAALKPGSYTLRWQALSTDGHITRGENPVHGTLRTNLIWFVRDFDLLSASCCGALSFALEALAFGGVFFLLFAAAPCKSGFGIAGRDCGAVAAGFALALAVTQIALIAATSAVLIGSSGHGPARCDLGGLFYWPGPSSSLHHSHCSAAPGDIEAHAGPLFRDWLRSRRLGSLSHAASRMDHRLLLVVLTAGHHLGMAAWIGALLFLLIALRLNRECGDFRRQMARRFFGDGRHQRGDFDLRRCGAFLVLCSSWQESTERRMASYFPRRSF